MMIKVAMSDFYVFVGRQRRVLSNFQVEGCEDGGLDFCILKGISDQTSSYGRFVASFW